MRADTDGPRQNFAAQELFKRLLILRKVQRNEPSCAKNITPSTARHEAPLLPQIAPVVPFDQINRSQWCRRRRRDNIQLTQVSEQKRERAFIAAPINNTSPPEELRRVSFIEVFQSKLCLNHPVAQSSYQPKFVPAGHTAVALLRQQRSKIAEMWRKWACFQRLQAWGVETKRLNHRCIPFCCGLNHEEWRPVNAESKK